MVKSKQYKKKVTINKRKRGLLRKAIELEMNCEQKIVIAIADPKAKTLVEFKNCHLNELKNYQNFELYDNDDYEALSNKFTTRK